MPFRRPTSPLCLEPLSTTEYDTDGLLGSDDELDESARAAKRRRIEKLGESYLQGKPLFIFSASLRGPFDDGWVNPWRKTRKRVPGLTHKKSVPRVTNVSDSIVIPETDFKKRTLEDELTRLECSRSQMGATSPSAVAAEEREDCSGKISRDVHSRPGGRSNGAEQVIAQENQRTTMPWMNRLPAPKDRSRNSLTRPVGESWLRTSREKVNIQHINPPKSPTPATSRPRGSMDISRMDLQRRNMSSCRCPSPVENAPSQVPRTKTIGFTPINSRKDSHSPESVSRHHSQSTSKLSAASQMQQSPARKSSKSKRQKMHKDESVQREERVHMEQYTSKDTSFETRHRSSLCIVPPSSHLPEFKYRRLKNPIDVTRLPSRHSSSVSPERQKDNNKTIAQPVQPECSTSDAMGDLITSDTNDEHLDARPDDGSPSVQGDSNRGQAGLAPISGTADSTGHNSHSTGSERIPSAQPIPGNSQFPDHAISLSSTDISRNHASAGEEDGNPDLPLSTQAALSLAQKFFQDDLATPHREIQPATGDDGQPSRRSVANNPATSSKITPFYRVNTAIQRASVTGSRLRGADGFQAMSTQCMIDAVTPFTFSTSKASDAGTGTTRKYISSNRKGNNASLEISPSSSPRDDSPSPPDRIDRGAGSVPFEPSMLNNQAEVGLEDPADALGNRSDTQLTALPLALTRSTPSATQQDGQGVAAGIDTFDLRQVIEETGSWLQQSWNVDRELKRCSGKSGSSPSSQTHRLAVSLDTIS